MTRCIWILIFALLGPTTQAGPGDKADLNATLWVQTATEWRAACRTAYRAAHLQLGDALTDPTWTAAPEQKGTFGRKKPAIILDVDETVLDNSPYQAFMVKSGTGFKIETWDAWVKQGEPAAIPGSLEFLKAADAVGVTIFYVTNRACSRRDGNSDNCPQENDTLQDLVRLGFPQARDENLLLKNEEPDWGSEKRSRREEVLAKHRLLMAFGDNLGDFLADVKKPGITPAERLKLTRPYEAWWGSRWFMLPNPLYGSWVNALGKDKLKHLRGFKPE